jgi:hypothetical protein
MGASSAVAAAFLVALTALAIPGDLWAQPSQLTAALIEAVTSNPGAAPKLTAQAVTAGVPDNAPSIVGQVVGALPSERRLSLAPRVVSAAIAALPAPQRAPQAAAVTCAAIRSVPAAEQNAVVPAIVAAAAQMAPTARTAIVGCAIQAVPALAQAIIAASALPPVQPEVIAPSSSPQPGSTIGRDILARPTQPAQICASPPCP